MKSVKRLRTLALLLMAGGMMMACGPKKNGKKNGEKLNVLSSFSIISEITEEIGEDSVDVHNLVPIGMAPHQYDPKPNDVKFASDADLILYNGLNLEGGDSGWLFKLVHSVNADTSEVYKVARGVEPQYVSDEEGKRAINPHAFISPKVGIIMAKNIRDALIASDHANASYYKKNAGDYIDKLKEVDRDYKDKIGKIPEEDRIFMASEQAFQYLTADYGLKEGHIWPIDTDKTGTPDQIKQAIAFVEKYEPPVLFIESNVDRRPMETVSKATGVDIYDPPVFSDELGKPGEKGDTYIKYLKYNLEQIYNGLKPD